MTFPRFHDLANYWKECPPAHVSINALVRGLSGQSGDKPKQKTANEPTDEELFGKPPFAPNRDLGQAVNHWGMQDAFPLRKMPRIFIDGNKRKKEEQVKP